MPAHDRPLRFIEARGLMMAETYTKRQKS